MIATLAVAVSLVACARPSEPLTQSRDVLGTTVSVTVYSEVADTDARIRSAFAAMRAVEAALSPYDSSSAIAAFNRAPYSRQALPSDALAIIDRTEELGVSDSFSPALFGVTGLYGFGGAGTVPAAATIRDAAEAARSLVLEDGSAWFPPLQGGKGARSITATPGLDFGGASKGLALDRGAQELRGLPALITAGSSTLAIGAKPDGQPWRVGIEDPREVGRVLAIVSSESTLSISTSGDYQTYFDRGGVRYHHILDPATGLPARGLRSLTVFGTMSALDADILSTALFVAGRASALDYAAAHGIGVYLVDDAGTAHSYVPSGSPIKLTDEAGSPRP